MRKLESFVCSDVELNYDDLVIVKLSLNSFLVKDYADMVFRKILKSIKYE